MFKSFAAACVLATTAYSTPDVTWESNGKFKINHPAFLNVRTFGDDTENPFLLVSSFKAFGHGAVYVVPDITQAVIDRDISHLKEVKLKTQDAFQWPNDVDVVPWDVFGFRAIVVPDGFLVPGHADGGVYVIQMDETDPTVAVHDYKISTEEDGFFYHMGEWIDLNNDGRKDFITARSNAKAGEGQLVWFEHPEEGLTGEWIEHIVCTGCADVGITILDDESPYKGEIVVLAAQFFDEMISFTRIEKKTGEMTYRVIVDDQYILSAYNIEYADINGDGTKEMIVNNHEEDEDTNGIYAYHFPSNWMTGIFTRTTLASHFKNKFNLFVPGMAPGFVYPFHPETSYSKHEAAHILIAGDGDYTAHIMTSTDTKTYAYDLDTLVEMKGTVGALCFDDVDNDGWQEVWVPDYNNGKIEMFNFAPVETGYLQ